MRFAEWVSIYGNVSKLAREVGVGRPDIYRWLRDGGPSKARFIAKVVEVSVGEVSHKDIIDGRLEVERTRLGVTQCG